MKDKISARDIYDVLVETGEEVVYNHMSDIYVKKTEKTQEIVDRYSYRENVGIFYNKGEAWYDIPFAYRPFWDEKSNKKINIL